MLSLGLGLWKSIMLSTGLKLIVAGENIMEPIFKVIWHDIYLMP